MNITNWQCLLIQKIRKGRIMNIFEQPKIDCHCHLFDPVRFPYTEGVPYEPRGHEIGTVSQFRQVMDVYGVKHALLVEPNSGYGLNNSCMLDAIKTSEGRFKGIAVVGMNASTEELEALKESGIVGIAFNTTALGAEYYKEAGDLVKKIESLDMFLQIQYERQDLLEIVHTFEDTHVKILIDHCGRPDITGTFDQPAFKKLLVLGKRENAYIKLSGYMKFSLEAAPYRDTWPYVRALAEAFGSHKCIWGSDWPFIRAKERVDYGILLSIFKSIFPDEEMRSDMLYHNPARIFGF
ncbi:MAG TPA: amidohydrolase family protein [Desulfosporosinus sp.]|nr:amidohydrolase family protein [Desulfosporosinus sp.]